MSFILVSILPRRTLHEEQVLWIRQSGLFLVDRSNAGRQAHDVRALRILNQRDEAIAGRVKQDIGRALGDESTEERAIEAAALAHAAMDQAYHEALRRAPSLRPACFSGCSSCCHVHAYATAPEIFALLAHLQGALGPQALQSLRDALSVRRRAVEALSDAERWEARIPCALLDSEGRCSIYEARPLRCRAFHSLSAEVCRQAFRGDGDAAPLTSPLLDRAVDAVERGYDAALAQVSLRTEGYRLEIALAILLHDPGAAARWLQGEDVLGPARGDQFEPSDYFSESE